MPKSPAAALTLPQTVLLLQPVLNCWDRSTPNRASTMPNGALMRNRPGVSLWSTGGS